MMLAETSTIKRLQTALKTVNTPAPSPTDLATCLAGSMTKYVTDVRVIEKWSGVIPHFCDGRYDMLERTITVREITPEQARFVLLHELGHAIMHQNEPPLGFDDVLTRSPRWRKGEIEADLFSTFVHMRLGWEVPLQMLIWLRPHMDEVKQYLPRPLGFSESVATAIRGWSAAK
jgi:hypothetical protein